MSISTEKFTNHAIHKNLEALENILSQAETIAQNQIKYQGIVEGLRETRRYTLMRLNAVDPLWMQKGILDSANTHITNITSYLTGYINDKNSAHLINAQNSGDALLTHLNSFPAPLLPYDNESLRDLVVSIRKSAGQYMRHIQDEHAQLVIQIEEANKKVKEIVTEINTQKGRVDTAISQFQQQFSQAEDNRRADFAKSEKSREERFSDAEKNRDTHLNDLLDDSRILLVRETEQLQHQRAIEQNRFDNLAKGFNERSVSVISTIEEQAKEQITRLERYKSDAETLLHAIGNTGMVSGYQQVANAERHAAWFWHGVTFLFFVGLVTFAIIAFVTTVQGDFKLGVFGARAFVAVAFGLGVAWAAPQAEKHQRVERSSRQMELILASINPYLAALPEPEQHEIKRLLAERLFHQEESALTGKAPETTGSLLDLLRMALKTVDDLAKK